MEAWGSLECVRNIVSVLKLVCGHRVTNRKAGGGGEVEVGVG